MIGSVSRTVVSCLVFSTLCTIAHAQTASYDTGSILDLDPPARQSTRTMEAISGADDMQSVSELSERDVLRRLARPVGRFTFKTTSGKLGHCTASLIANDLILTNHHCIADAKAAMLWMGYLYPRSRKGVTQHRVVLPPVEANKMLDYAILRVEGAPGKMWGTVNLTGLDVASRQSLFIVHHPGGFAQRISLGRCRANDPARDKDDVLHVCDTLSGSSGAPIFDNDTRKVVALHYSAVDLRGLNAGKSMSRLIEASPILQRLAANRPNREGTDVRHRQCEDTTVEYGQNKRACVKPGSGKTFRDCADCPDLTVVPGGDIMIGSPPNEHERMTTDTPRQSIRLHAPYAIATMEISQSDWRHCVRAGDCAAVDHRSGENKPTHPIAYVSWSMARDYTRWLTRKTRYRYRLPSEAEWEAAARGRKITAYAFGDSDQSLGDHAWFKSNSKGSAQPVGVKRTNPFGLFDTHGNVWEWTSSCWRKTFAQENATAQSEACKERTVRGGSYDVIARGLRSSARVGLLAGYRDADVGFRVVREITPVSTAKE